MFAIIKDMSKIWRTESEVAEAILRVRIIIEL